MGKVTRKRSNDVEQRHEAEIHMRLHMAVEQRPPQQLGRKIHIQCLITADHRHVLVQAGRRITRDVRDLERSAKSLSVTSRAQPSLCTRFGAMLNDDQNRGMSPTWVGSGSRNAGRLFAIVGLCGPGSAKACGHIHPALPWQVRIA